MTVRKIAIVGLTALLVFCCAMFAVIALLPPQPVKTTHVTVVRIANNPRRFGQTVTVTFRTDDGLIGSDTLPANVIGCAVGDEVPAYREGVSIGLRGRACRIQHSQ